jgi:5-hydroxyisourate hydrolase
MISTHILDLQSGLPGKDVSVVLSKKQGDKYVEIKSGITNADGRISFENSFDAGIYQLTFQTDEYFGRQNRDPFFANAQVTFNIKDTKRKFHIPLLLSPFGYSTYRGS